MKITRKEVEHVALLARLELAKEDVIPLTDELNAILTYMDKLNELDTKEVTPTSHVIDVGNVVRDDDARDSIPVKKALENAPDSGEGFLKVPKII